MSTSTERYHSGPQCIITLPVESATVVKKGDFICMEAGNEYAVPAASLADAGDAAANRELGADTLVGIAMGDSAAGETERIPVDISLESVFQLDLQAAAALSFGDLLEIYATTLACDSQALVAGSTSQVAVCVKEKSATGTAVLCKLLPQKLLHSEQT